MFYLHFALKRRAFFEEIQEKQEQVCVVVTFYVFAPFCQFIYDLGRFRSLMSIFHWKIILKVKEWLQNLGMGDHMAVVQEDDEGDEIAVNHDESSKKRSVTTCYDGHE